MNTKSYIAPAVQLLWMENEQNFCSVRTTIGNVSRTADDDDF